MTTIEVMHAALEDLNREAEGLQRSCRAIELTRQSRNSSHVAQRFLHALRRCLGSLAVNSANEPIARVDPRASHSSY